MIQEDFIARQVLVDYITKYQQREKTEDLDLLAQNGDDITWLARKVHSHLPNGILNDQNSLLERKRLYGSNEKKVKLPPGFFKLFCEALEDFTLRILLVAALLSIGLETGTAHDSEERKLAWIEGFAILVAVMVCASVTAINDYQKQRQFIELNAVADQKRRVTVWRQGKQISIHEDLLHVGDILDIHEGMDLPADGLLLQSNEITTDESAMTGQTEPIHKNTLQRCLKKKKEVGTDSEDCKHEIPSPVMMSGTKVLTGEGKMIVVVVGELSCVGKIRALASQDDDVLTPLQQKLEKVAGDIGKFGLYSAIFIVIVLLIRFGIVKGTATEQKDKWHTSQDLVRMLKFIILGITVVVVAIPQGLPLAVTISLAFSVKKMLKDNNLVRRMEACETMGGANNICSDKTGTLTMNQMTVNQIWNQETSPFDITKQQLTVDQFFKNKEYYQLFKICSLVNSAAILEPQVKGSATQICFLRMFRKMGIQYGEQRQKHKIEVKYPFSSSRKRMSIITNYNDHQCLFIKGASQIILEGCKDWFNSKTGRIEPVDGLKSFLKENVIKKMAENTLRTLCLAYKPISPHQSFEEKDDKGVYQIEKNNLILIAIIGVRDIPRPEVPAALEICHQAGIVVRMVTGDNIITAKAIAKEIGLFRIKHDAIAMQGPEFTRLVGGVVCAKCKTAKCDCPTDPQQASKLKKQLRVDTIAKGEEFQKIKDNLLILARSRPEDKYCLVTALKERGNVVAVTGDGTNDAPALRKADVGFAMGISGTEVAREAAAIILMDDNFNSIVKAVLWGRNIYDSIRKFIQFQLTVNVVAVVITLVGAALLQKEVLKPIQMLWVNLIMDTLASLALATQQPNPQLLKRKPHNRDDYIINRVMLKHIIGQSIYQLIILIIMVFMGQRFIPEYVDNHDFVTDPSSAWYAHPEYKWRDGIVGGTICSGRFYFVNGKSDYFSAFEQTKVYSRHFTIVFNVFVMMQVFNFLNARKLHEQLNIFAGITQNPLFIIIVGSIMGIQIILVTFAGYPFGLYDNGLTIYHWLICIGLGSISLLVNFLLKMIPISVNAKVEDISKLQQSNQPLNTQQDSHPSIPVANEQTKLTFQKLKYESRINEGTDLFLVNEVEVRQA